ncbi:hypothetical protein M3Y98_00068100 [Aphelenchoides besseyi]|nr:hypothetical protein M3Y98_00068100 [Aphelenchoides besseyi]
MLTDYTDEDTQDAPLSSSAGSSNQQPTTSSSSAIVPSPPNLNQIRTPADELMGRLRLPRDVDQTTVQEFLVHLHQFFAQIGFSSVADELKRELETKQLLPPQFTIDGTQRPQSLESYLLDYGDYSSDLLALLSQFNQKTNSTIPPVLPGLNLRLFVSERTSLMRRTTEVHRDFASKLTTSRVPVNALNSCSAMNVLMARELGVRISTRILQRKVAFNSDEIKSHGKFQGHIKAAFCVTFDQSGRYILTGSDDKLIKVWDTTTGRLRYTFRGCTSEVCDLSINMENTCLSTGSKDKIVRAWRLSDGRPVMVYKRHSAVINAVRFIPFAEGDVRYMVSTGNDCMVVFYKYSASDLHFESEPIRYEEREQRGAQMLSASYSSGGNFVVMGDSAHIVHIYKLTVETVVRISEFTAHLDQVDSLVWASSVLSFASGSKDGTSKIWRFTSGEWTPTELRVTDVGLSTNSSQAVNQETTTATTTATTRRGTYKVLMLGWTCDDSRIVTTGSDYLVRVWDSRTGQQLRKLQGHTDDAYVIACHHIHPELVYTAGHEGLIILWDIDKGTILWQHRNIEEQHQMPLSIFDLTLSPLGERFAYVDAMGLLSVWGLGTNKTKRRHLQQQYYANDYEPIHLDSQTGFVYDDQRRPVHLSPPALLVNIDQHPYGPEEQRHVITDILDEDQIISPWNDSNKIIEPLSAGELALRMAERAQQSERELCEYEAGRPIDPAELEGRRVAAHEAEQQRRNERLQRQREQRRHKRAERELRMQQIYEPTRYVIDDSWTDAEDADYSAGEDEPPSEHENTTFMDQSDSLTDDENLEDIVDDCDSDYELGRPERETVHRNRSALTVTGRPKRRVTRPIDQEASSSSQQANASSPPLPNPTRSGRQPRLVQRMSDINYERPIRRRQNAPTVQRRSTRRRALIESGSPVSSISPQPGPSSRVIEEEEPKEQKKKKKRKTMRKRRKKDKGEEEDEDEEFGELQVETNERKSEESETSRAPPPDLDIPPATSGNRPQRHAAVVGDKRRRTMAHQLEEEEGERIRFNPRPMRSSTYRKRIASESPISSISPQPGPSSRVIEEEAPKEHVENELEEEKENDEEEGEEEQDEDDEFEELHVKTNERKSEESETSRTPRQRPPRAAKVPRRYWYDEREPESPDLDIPPATSGNRPQRHAAVVGTKRRRTMFDQLEEEEDEPRRYNSRPLNSNPLRRSDRLLSISNV